VREKRKGTSWLDHIIDPVIQTNYDESKMELLAKVSLDCVKENKDKANHEPNSVNASKCSSLLLFFFQFL